MSDGIEVKPGIQMVAEQTQALFNLPDPAVLRKYMEAWQEIKAFIEELKAFYAENAADIAAVGEMLREVIAWIRKIVEWLRSLGGAPATGGGLVAN